MGEAPGSGGAIDADKALALLRVHQQARALEIANEPPPEKDPNEPKGQVIDLGLPTSPPAAPPAAKVAPPEIAGAEALASSAEGDVDVSSEGTAALLGRLQRLQVDRVKTYRAFDEGLDACRSADGAVDVGAYATVVEKITVVFNLISMRFNACEAALRARSLAAAADSCRAVQTLEKEKLELTAAKHLGACRPETDASRKHVDARLRAVVAAINDALDELKCELLEAD